MKKIFLTLIAMTLIHCVHAKGDAISFISDAFPPYVIGKNGDRGVVGGILPWYITEIFRQLDGNTPYYEVMPWQRCMREVKEGNYDAIMQMRFSEERAKDYVFSIPYLTSKFKLYYSVKRFPEGVKSIDLNKLQGYQVLATEGYYYGDQVEIAEKKGQIKLTRTTFNENNLDLLIKGRADFYLSDSIVAEYYIERAKLQMQIMAMEGDLGSSAYHFAFSKKSPLVSKIDKINKIIKKMEKDNIFKKWLKDDSDSQPK